MTSSRGQAPIRVRFGENRLQMRPCRVHRDADPIGVVLKSRAFEQAAGKPRLGVSQAIKCSQGLDGRCRAQLRVDDHNHHIWWRALDKEVPGAPGQRHGPGLERATSQGPIDPDRLDHVRPGRLPGGSGDKVRQSRMSQVIRGRELAVARSDSIALT